MSRQSRYEALIRIGWLPGEARQLSHTSRTGMQAPYFQRMLLSRRGLFLRAKQLGWTDKEYRDAIRQIYIDKAAIKQDARGRLLIDVWKLLQDYENTTPITDEYESPWRKKAQKRSSARRVIKQTTRKTTIQDWIAQLTRNINNPNISDFRRNKYIEQRNNLEEQLKRLQ